MEAFVASRSFLTNEEGKIILDKPYQQIMKLSNGLFALRNDSDTWEIANKYGELVKDLYIPSNYEKTFPSSYFISCSSYGHVCIFMEDKEWHFINADGEIGKNGYKEIDFLHGSPKMIPVRNDILWGLADKSGNLVVPFEYDSFANMSLTQSSMILAKKSGKYGYICDEGREKIPFILDGVYQDFYFEDHLNNFIAIPSINGKRGILSINEGFILNCEFDKIDIRNDGLFVKNNGLLGFYNFKGKEILPPIYKSIFHYKNTDLLLVCNTNGKQGLACINTGEFAVPCMYSEFIYMYKDFAVFKDKNSYVLYQIDVGELEKQELTSDKVSNNELSNFLMSIITKKLNS